MSTTKDVRAGDNFIYDGQEYKAQSDPKEYPYSAFGPAVTIKVDGQEMAFQVKGVTIFVSPEDLKPYDKFTCLSEPGDVLEVVKAPHFEGYRLFKVACKGDRTMYLSDHCPVKIVARPLKTVQVMGDGRPRTFTAIGGYPVFYLTHDEEVICPICALTEIVEFEQVDTFDGPYGNFEDPALDCFQCSTRIASAYNEPLHSDKDRISECADDAITAMFEVVAKEYEKEVNTGDFPVCDQIDLHSAVEKAITSWLKFNGKDEQ